MKIMYIIDTSPINGGAPISTVILANEMINNGHTVSIVMPKNNKKDTHISRLRILLDLRPANGFIVTSVYGVGYRFETTEQVQPA